MTIQWTATTRSLLAEQDMERARLRARIAYLEAEHDLPPSTDGESMAAAYRQQARALAAVLDYFDADQYTLKGLPRELHAAFRPLVVT